MSSEHVIQPLGRQIRRLSCLGSTLGVVVIVYAWSDPDIYLVVGTGLVAAIWWITFQVVRAPDSIVLRDDGILEFRRWGATRQMPVRDVRWILGLDRSIVLVRYRGGLKLITRWYDSFAELVEEIARQNPDASTSI